MDAREVGVGEGHLRHLEPSPGSMLITPGGIPASTSSSIVRLAASCWVGLGFQMTTLPIRAGAVGRLPAIAVKLNGVTA